MSQKDSQAYEVLSITQIVNLMSEEITKVQNIVNLPQNQIRQLLNLEKWDIGVFLEKFYDGRIKIAANDNLLENVQDEASGTFRRSKRKSIAEPAAMLHPIKRCKSMLGKPKAFCDICLESYNTEDVCHVTYCKHVACFFCLRQYLSALLGSNSSIDCISCPGFNCNSLLSDALVLNQLSKEMKLKYQQLITNGFVQSNRLIKWCVAPGCTKAIKVPEGNQSAVRCHCGHFFCFQCTQEVHDLIPCKLLRDFTDTKVANFETATWLIQNSKQCPKCRVDIEKNGGCNHITCRVCRFEFCWICLYSWRSHNNCVTPEATVFQTTDLRRLVDCNNKHQTMIQSIKLDEKQYKLALQKQDLETKEQWIKIDFVKQAVNTLLLCRRSLADSYIFAYFYRSDNDTQWVRFNMNQSALIEATEGLSHVLETQVNGDNFHQMKRQVKDHKTLCEGFHRALFEHVQEGLENDSWTKTM